ncbi:S-adenosyl-L-methionine-dependent methyltransferase [Gloeopeniophorella convolvens]|nr:S-adenosyl-L-methionine-dependent methyltransferase [Gloeopeniophorella convolvens]
MSVFLSDSVLNVGYALLDQGYIPDFALRQIIRALCKQRLREIDHGSFEANAAAKMQWIEVSRSRVTIADATDAANEQHYEVPAAFLLQCLGPRAKYSSCIYPTGKETLAEAEVLMFEEYCKKAQLMDGQYVLDLGCGWGSLSLFLAEKYPRSRIIGLSNSYAQKLHIDEQASKRGLKNLKIITADVNIFNFEEGCERFDRILSIEMFEHMRNYDMLLRKVASWLRPSKSGPTSPDPDPALLFIHIFCHRTSPYNFEQSDGWMAQTFFSGGTMPSYDMLLYFQDHVTLLDASYVSGTHYSRTLYDWLALQDSRAAEGIKILQEHAVKKGLPREEGSKMWYRFRVFFIACAELFGMKGGQEWGIGLYVFKRKD